METKKQLIKKLKQLDKKGTKLVLKQFYKTETGKRNFQNVINEMLLISKKLNWDSIKLHHFMKEQFDLFFKRNGMLKE